VGLDDEFDTARLEGLVNLLDVVDFVVDDRRYVVHLRPVGDAQHDTNPATVKKCHVWRRLK
jgi:hypothetical protein